MGAGAKTGATHLGNWLALLNSLAATHQQTAVIGKNGVGKSTLFDAFGFLSDCLKGGVEEALRYVTKEALEWSTVNPVISQLTAKAELYWQCSTDGCD